MSLDGYTLTCQRGHDRATFTGQAALDHVQACHGRKPGTVPTVTGWKGVRHFGRWQNEPIIQNHTWKPCDQVVKARPWVAPKAPKEVPAAFLAKLPDFRTRKVRWGSWAFVWVKHEYVAESSECVA